MGEPIPIVSSLGGPRIMLPAASAHNWLGADGAKPTHYDRACEVEGICGSISPWGEPLLVFADEPNDLYVLERPDGALFFKWAAADSV